MALSTLAAENSSWTAAPVDSVFLVGHGGVEDEIFPSRSDDQGPVWIPGTAFSRQDVSRFVGVFPQRWLASQISTRSGVMSMKTGWAPDRGLLVRHNRWP